MTNVLAPRPVTATSPQPQLTLPAIALSAAPAFWIAAWLLMRIDGHGGPGWGWTTAHLLWMGAYVLFGIASVALFRAGGRPGRLSAPALAVALTGAFAFVGQMLIDLVMGILASDKAELSELYDTATSVPFVELALYQVGPPFLFAGLLALVIAAAWHRQVEPWTAVAAGAGIAAIVAGRVGPESIRFVEGFGGLVLLVALTAIAGAVAVKRP